jgi:hypothetical protein
VSVILNSKVKDPAPQLSGDVADAAAAAPYPGSYSETTLALLDDAIVPHLETSLSDSLQTIESEPGDAHLASGFQDANATAPATQPTVAVLSPSDIESALASTDFAPSDWIVALGVLALLGGLWMALLYFISGRGWRSFALRYRAPGRPPPRGFLADQVSFGTVLSSYRGVVRVAFLSEGLYLTTTPSFRAFHRPLLIPWDCVKSFKRRRDVANSRYRIEIEDSAGRILLRLPGKIGAHLRTVLPPAADSTSEHAGYASFVIR